MLDLKVAEGIVEALQAASVNSKIYVLGYFVEKFINDQGATWWIFKAVTPGQQDFQYTPGGNWELITEQGVEALPSSCLACGATLPKQNKSGYCKLHREKAPHRKRRLPNKYR